MPYVVMTLPCHLSHHNNTNWAKQGSWPLSPDDERLIQNSLTMDTGKDPITDFSNLQIEGYFRHLPPF